MKKATIGTRINITNRYTKTIFNLLGAGFPSFVNNLLMATNNATNRNVPRKRGQKTSTVSLSSDDEP